MPSLPPIGRELPDRPTRLFEQWRQILDPLPEYYELEGAPEGVFTAPRGALYFQTGGTQQLFFKTSLTGNTGWQPLINVDTPVTPEPDPEPAAPSGDITGDSLTITGDVTVDGSTTLASLIVLGTSDLRGAVTMGSTLAVTGATSLASTLGVTGATSLSTLSTTGDATIGGNLSISGAFSPASLAVSGNATIGGTLGVTGVSTLGTLNAADGNFSSTLGVVGATTLSTLSTSGNAAIGGDLTVSGAFSPASLAVSGNATIGGTLGVTGATTLSSTLAVTGIATFDDANVGGNLDVTGTFNCDDTATVAGAVALNSTAAVDLVDAIAALRVGPASSQHLELAGDVVQSKGTATTASELKLNSIAGNILLGTASATVRSVGTQAITLSNANAAFLVGTQAGAHLELDFEGLQAKSSATAATTLDLNNLGGAVRIGQLSGADAVTTRGLETRIEGNVAAPLLVRNMGDGGPAIGASQDVSVQWETSKFDPLGYVGFAGQVHFDVVSQNHGGHVRIRAENTSGTTRTLVDADPDIGVGLYHVGSLAAQTSDESGTDTTSWQVRNPAGTLVPAGVGQMATNILSSSSSLARTGMLGMTRLTGSLSTLTLPNTSTIPNNSYGWIVNQTGGNITITGASGISVRSHIRIGNHTMSANSLVFWWKQSTIWYLSGDGLS